MAPGRTGVRLTLFSWGIRRIIGYGAWKNRRMPNFTRMVDPGYTWALRLGGRSIPNCIPLEGSDRAFVLRLAQPVYT